MYENSNQTEVPETEYIPVSSPNDRIAPRPESFPDSGKTKKGFRVKTLAIICGICIILSGICAFSGTLIANRIMPGNDLPNSDEQPAESVEPSSDQKPVVIYKSAATAVSSSSAVPGEKKNYAQVAALVKDSVVEISTEHTTRNAWFQYTTGGAGSGVILSADGHIITNAHVILDNDTQSIADSITVRLTDGTEYPAEVKAYDTDEDIAILKIDAHDLTPASIGDSGKLTTGEELLIVGNPLGELGGSVSNGIVSATERDIQVSGVTMRLIQTNAAVNPGNSGGGMFNMKGELVGLVNAKSSGMNIEGIGFAIPVNQVISVSEQLLTKGYVSGKPTIGVSLEDVSVDNSLSFFFGTGAAIKAGVYVKNLAEGMNDKSLEIGDRIIAVNGKEVSSSDDVKAEVYKSSIGDKLTVQIYRGEKLLEKEITVFERTPDVKFSEDKPEAAAESSEDEKQENSGNEAQDDDASQGEGNLFDFFEYFFNGR